MKKIAFSNFRRFQDFPLLELGKISVIVGRNNSGKSTMVKAFLLFLDYLQNQQYNEFSFSNKSLEDANIVTFGRAIKSGSSKEQISFQMQIDDYLFTTSIYGNSDDTNANVSNLLIEDFKSKLKIEINYFENYLNVVKYNSEIVEKFDSLNDLIKEMNELEKEIKSKDFNNKSLSGIRFLDRYNFLRDKLNKLSDNVVEDYQENETDEVFNISYPLLFSEYINADSRVEEFINDLIYKEIGVPITHDFHHHNYGPQDLSAEDALKLALSTWGDITPMTHMSSPKTLEDTSGKQTAHADYIYEEIKTFGLDFDTEIEAKAKDLAVIRYRNQFKVLKG